MFILQSSEAEHEALVRSARRYAVAAICCAVFSFVHEQFSHEVYSPFMVGLFLVPLLVGMLPALVLARMNVGVGWLARDLWAASVLVLTLGCCFIGVLEIYGTGSPYVPIYVIVGGAFGFAAATCAVCARRSGGA